MRRLDRLRSGGGERSSLSLEAWAQSFQWNGNNYGLGSNVQTTMVGTNTESIGSSFAGYVNAGYKGNGVVFAVILARMLLFSEARFMWQRIHEGRPGELFADAELNVLDRPWTNATIGTLLSRIEQDVSLAGNFYGVRRESSLRRLSPQNVQVVYGSLTGDPIDSEPVAYLHWPSGVGSGQPTQLMASEVVHYAPIPDPTAMFRGMSWLTPLVDEIRSDTAATRHKSRFFDNAATPNLAVSLDKAYTRQEYVDFVTAMQDHEGAENAYKTLWLGGGADVKVIGADLKQLDFKLTQGAGETRICAAGGVPPIIVGLSEGLQAATYSNYGMARRKFGDHWARPQWRSVAGALETVLARPADARLWYDDRDISFLQEDMKDDAEIQHQRASTIKTLVDSGYLPETVVDAVDSGDLTKLVHSGLYSVMLQPAGSGPSLPPEGVVTNA